MQYNKGDYQEVDLKYTSVLLVGIAYDKGKKVHQCMIEKSMKSCFVKRNVSCN